MVQFYPQRLEQQSVKKVEMKVPLKSLKWSPRVVGSLGDRWINHFNLFSHTISTFSPGHDS